MQPRHAKDGQVLIMFAVASLLMVAMLALAVDVGYMYAQRRQAQAAVDAAALAADVTYQRARLDAATPVAAIREAGAYYIEANGYNAADATITPLATYNIGNQELQRCVRAELTTEVPKFFIGAIYQGDWEVSTEAVACTSPEPRDYAIVVLDPNGSGINAFGTSNMTIHDGGAMSNAAMDFTGNTTWIQMDGPLDAYNDISIGNNATVKYDSINKKAPQIPDPYGDVDPPTHAQCGPTRQVPDLKVDPLILEPGTYGALTIKGGDARNIVLTGGVYCFDGDFEVQSGKGNPRYVYGEDVLLYFRGSAELNIHGGGVQFSVSHTSLPAAIKTSAPQAVRDALGGGSCTAAACDAEIVVYYNRTNCNDLHLEGGNRLYVAGVIYAPCSLVTLRGHSGSEVVGQVIGGSADFGGTTSLTITYASTVDAKVPQVFLVQ